MGLREHRAGAAEWVLGCSTAAALCAAPSMGTLFVPRGVLLPAGKWTVDEVDLLQSLVASYRQALEQQEAADGPRTISSSMLPSGATEARPAFRVRAGQRAHICSMHSDGMSVQLQLSIVWQLGVLGRMRAGRAVLHLITSSSWSIATLLMLRAMCWRLGVSGL